MLLNLFEGADTTKVVGIVADLIKGLPCNRKGKGLEKKGQD